MFKKLLLIPAAILLLAACQSSPNAAAPTPANVERAGNPERGRALFNTLQPDASITCSTCHRTDTEDRLVGPGLLHVSDRAQNRVADGEAARYLHDSIINPSAYVVEGYPDVMPKNWATIFSEDELADLIAYLMTLR
jgi:cytochrome c2